MFTKRIIPCLDVNNGRVVKGVNFVDLKDAGDPVEIAKAYDAAGADEVVFLDITASCEQRDTVVDMVRKVAANVFIPFTVGGCIRTLDDFRKVLREGADKISVNSAAIDRPELIREAADKFGSQCVVVAIDAKRRPDGGWNIYKHGGRLDTGIDAIEWAKKAEALGAGEILLTSMDCDGTKAGYDIPLTRAVSDAVSIPVIGNGDVVDGPSAAALMKETGCGAVMVGRGAQGNPWIFPQIRHYLATGEVLPPPTAMERYEQMLSHFEALLAYKGEYIGVREMRSHASWYTHGLYGSAALRERINRAASADEFRSIVRDMMDKAR